MSGPTPQSTGDGAFPDDPVPAHGENHSHLERSRTFHTFSSAPDLPPPHAGLHCRSSSCENISKHESLERPGNLGGRVKTGQPLSSRRGGSGPAGAVTARGRVSPVLVDRRAAGGPAAAFDPQRRDQPTTPGDGRHPTRFLTRGGELISRDGFFPQTGSRQPVSDDRDQTTGPGPLGPHNLGGPDRCSFQRDRRRGGKVYPP